MRIKFLFDDWSRIIKLLDPPVWNVLPAKIWNYPHITCFQLESDVCMMGWGAVYSSHWVHGQWSPTLQSWHINELEAAALALSFSTFRSYWKSGSCLQFGTDNQALLGALNKRASRNPRIHEVVRFITIWCSTKSICWKAYWIPSRRNILPDHLSRFGSFDFPRVIHRLNKTCDANASSVIVPHFLKKYF